MRIIIMALGALSLAACQTPHITSATSAGGIVSSYGWQPNKSLMLADAYCAKLGKAARVSHESDWQDHMTFDCVAK
jgi:hypothetical protein